MNNKIAVIMSTYNGDKYIRYQIDSILNQKNVDVYLFIRDDGSTDSTIQIINEYVKKNDNIIFINNNNVKNLGILNSYLITLKYAIDNIPNIDYFSFADQDDYWIEEKLYAALTKMKYKLNAYQLYYSNKTFVDSNLNKISEQKIIFYDDFIEALSSNLASGCTMVFNRMLAKLVVSENPHCATYHDDWVYRLSKYIGAQVIFDNSSYILYRQHQSNVSGMKACKNYDDSIKTNVKIFFHKKKLWRCEAIAEYDSKFSKLACEEARYYSKLLTNYRKNIKMKFKLAFDKKTKKRGFKFKWFWRFKVLMNKL